MNRIWGANQGSKRGKGATTGTAKGSDDETIAAALCDLLSTEPKYRELWEPLVQQRSSQLPNQAAVARVVTDYLVDNGGRKFSQTSPRTIKDRISRALRGKGLSTETLRWLIDAFDMSEVQAERLWGLHSCAAGDGRSEVATWTPEPVPLPRNSDWETLSLHELHTLGPDGIPSSHRTVQVLRALKDGLSEYLFRFDTSAVRIDVARGGTAGPIRDLGEGLYGLYIKLPGLLSVGETASLEYITTFRYEQPPPPEFRRAFIRRVAAIEMRVQFHPDRLPRQVLWGTWDDLDGEILQPQRIHLDGEHSAHRYLSKVESTIVGFTWEFDPPLLSPSPWTPLSPI